MIEAEIQGKVSSFENKEDVLTSNVFGLLELVDYYAHLPTLIAGAHNIKDTSQSFENVVNIKNLKVTRLTLWKSFDALWGKFEEPDVYVELHDDERVLKIIIEVKYKSPESIKYVDDTQIGQLKRYIMATKADYLIYLTASHLSAKHLQTDNLEYGDKIFHIHWEDLNRELKKIIDSKNGIEKKVLQKISDYLDFKGFFGWEQWNMDFLNISSENTCSSFYGPSYFKFDFNNIQTEIKGEFYAKK
jgi:Holliday junction resolvase